MFVLGNRNIHYRRYNIARRNHVVSTNVSLLECTQENPVGCTNYSQCFAMGGIWNYSCVTCKKAIPQTM